MPLWGRVGDPCAGPLSGLRARQHATCAAKRPITRDGACERGGERHRAKPADGARGLSPHSRRHCPGPERGQWQPQRRGRRQGHARGDAVTERAKRSSQCARATALLFCVGTFSGCSGPQRLPGGPAPEYEARPTLSWPPPSAQAATASAVAPAAPAPQPTSSASEPISPGSSGPATTAPCDPGREGLSCGDDAR